MNLSFGGVFSKYMHAVQNSVLHPIADKYYLNIIDQRTNCNMFDYIFEQELNGTYQIVNVRQMISYSTRKKIEDSLHFSNYRKFIEKLSFKKELLSQIESYKQTLGINKNTIGVHIRLTDMNKIHEDDYGIFKFDDYLKHIDPSKNYFVSSDNSESIEKLKSIIPNMTYIKDCLRVDTEDGDSLNLQLENFRNPKLWVDAFLEMLLLSECGSIVCRTSGLSNAAILHSKGFHEIKRL